MFEHLDDDLPFRPDPGMRRAVTRDGGRRQTRRRREVAVLSVVVPVVLVASSIAAYGRWQTGRIVRFSVAAASQTEPDGRPAALNLDDLQRPFTLLFVGTDDRSGLVPPTEGPGRTDTIMLVEVDMAAGAVRIVSVPRDLWVPLANGAGTGRINAALGHGRQTLIETVNQVLGITVDHYAEIDFEGFAHLVDAEGGVPVVFAETLRDPASGLDVEAGCRVLDGRTALALARSRHLSYRDDAGRWHEDTSSDLGRMARQQALVAAAAGAAGQRAGDLGALADLARITTDNVALDDHLGLGDLTRLSEWTSSLGPEAVRSMTPAVVPLTTADHAQVLQLAPGAALEVQRFLEGDAVPASPAPGPTGAPPASLPMISHVRAAPGGRCP
jgi:LCP family protein required for cell wall assembly